MAFTLEESKREHAYEAVIIVHPEASEAEQKELFTKNKSIVESFGGAMNSVETWGKRPLANAIDKSQIGNYFYATFKTSPEAIKELERTMRINDKVLRFLNVRLKDNTDLNKHVEEYHQILADAEKKRREFEEKAKKRAAARKTFNA